MSKPLPRSTPEAIGVNPAAITAFLNRMEAEKLELHGFMMLRGGSVVAEGWWKPYAAHRPHMLFSLSKSFTSTAVGFAVTEGLLSVDDPVLKFFPEEAPEEPTRHWAEMKVRHLLSMSTGHAVDTTGFMMRRRDSNWVKGFLSRPVKHKPGTHFLYNTGATYMLSVIVQRLTGQRVLDYLTPRLFEPLGIEGAAWDQCPMGYDTGGFGLSIKTEDIARFGQFLLQRGMWEGRQLLPAAWIDEATAKHVDNSATHGNSDWGMGYGYQFWRCIPEGIYRGDGAFGQFCVVAPKLDTVIAINSGTNDMGGVMKGLWELLATLGEPLAEDAEARKAMTEKLASLKYDPPVAQAFSPTEADVTGKTYELERNPDHLAKLCFDFHESYCDVKLTYGRKTYTLPCGRGRWVEGGYPAQVFGGHLSLMESTASFTWLDQDTMELTVRVVGAPYVVTAKVKFGGEGLEFAPRLNVNMGPTELPPVKGQLVK